MEPLHHPGKAKDRDGPEASSTICYKYRNTSSVTDMLEDLNWDTLETRRAKSQVTMMFEIINGLVDILAADFVTPASTRTKSHHGKKLRQYATSTDTLKYSFFPFTIPLWNSFRGPPRLGILQVGAVYLLIIVQLEANCKKNLVMARAMLVGLPYPLAVTIARLV